MKQTLSLEDANLVHLTNLYSKIEMELGVVLIVQMYMMIIVCSVIAQAVFHVTMITI
jgi:hypothetical protein